MTQRHEGRQRRRLTATETDFDVIQQRALLVGTYANKVELEDAELSMAELALLTETHYQHATHVVEAQGVFDVDCSGFADYILGRALPTPYGALIAEASAHPRPLAVDYVNFFAGPPAASSG